MEITLSQTPKGFGWYPFSGFAVKVEGEKAFSSEKKRVITWGDYLIVPSDKSFYLPLELV